MTDRPTFSSVALNFACKFFLTNDPVIRVFVMPFAEKADRLLALKRPSVKPSRSATLVIEKGIDGEGDPAGEMSGARPG
jgi:hypothetical protein